MKFKAKAKDCQLLVKAKTSIGESIDEKELDRFSRVYLRGFLKPKMVKRNLIEYTGPVGISLYERLKKPTNKREFLFILEQIVVAVQKLQANGMGLNNLVMDLQHVYINEVTKEIQFIYIPTMKNGLQNLNLVEFIESIAYSVKPADNKDNDFVARFIYFFKAMVPFDINKVESFVAKEDRSVINTIKKQNAGQSGFMTDKPQHYYDHYAGKEKSEDDDPTGLLVEDDDPTGLLVDDEDDPTGLLVDDDEPTGLLNADDNEGDKGEDSYTLHMPAFSANANYTFDVKCVDKAGNPNDGVNYGTSVAPTEFTIDKTKPNVSLTIEGKAADKSWTETWSTANGDGVRTDIDYNGRWSNSAAKVSATSTDDLSGIDYIEYFRTENIVTNITAPGITWSNSTKGLDANRDTFEFEVAPNEKFIVYVHVVDKAGKDIYLSSNGVIVDDKAPGGDQYSPEIDITLPTANANGIYNKDDTVQVDLKVVEPKYSGAGTQTDTGIYDALVAGNEDVLNDAELLMLVIDNQDALLAICNNSDGLAAYKNIIGRYKNMKVCIAVFIENASIPYSAPEIMKNIRDQRNIMYFDDISNIRN